MGVMTGSATSTSPCVMTTCEGSMSGHGSAILRISTRVSVFFAAAPPPPSFAEGAADAEDGEVGDFPPESADFAEEKESKREEIEKGEGERLKGKSDSPWCFSPTCVNDGTRCL